MSTQLQLQIEKLKKSTLQLGGRVEQALYDAVHGLEEKNMNLAKQVIANDNEINRIETELEENCLATLALHQPVAFDLRYVVGLLKMCNDLERIGDMAVHIAEQTLALSYDGISNTSPLDLQNMTEIVQEMLHKSLDALVNVDVKLATWVRDTDNQVDEIHRTMYTKITNEMQENPHQITKLVHVLGISRNLERIADHAVNMADDVIYMADADFFKKKLEERKKQHEQNTGVNNN